VRGAFYPRVSDGIPVRVSANPEKAFSLQMRAAEQGYAPAQRAVGAAYLEGEGVERDPKQALHFLTQAAASDDADAKAWLGWMYANGQGVPLDEAQALGWFGRRRSRACSASASFPSQKSDCAVGEEKKLHLSGKFGKLPMFTLRLM
jgi:TPR repeat protein